MTATQNMVADNVLPVPVSRRTAVRTASSVRFAQTLIAGPIVCAAAWMILGLLRPGYSLITQPISGLGVGPYGALMNAAFVLSGASLTIGLAGVCISVREWGTFTRVLNAGLLSLSGIGGVLVGVFTFESFLLHFVGFGLAFVAPIISFIVVGVSLRALPRWRSLGTGFIFASPLTLVLVGLFLWTFSPSRVEARIGIAGLTERIALLEIHAWFVLFALWTIRLNRGGAFAKAYKGPAMEGFIATWYAKTTKGDVRGYRSSADSVVQRVPTGGDVLEIATGPGYLAIEIAKTPGYRVRAMDISHSFVRIGAENARAAGVNVEFKQGNAAELPYADGSFDFVVCRAAFKNFADPGAAINEMHRVLKPGGQASVFDLRHESTDEEIETLVRSLNLSATSAWWTRITFRYFLLKNAYTRMDIEALAKRSRFGGCEVVANGIEFDLRLTKSSAIL